MPIRGRGLHTPSCPLTLEIEGIDSSIGTINMAQRKSEKPKKMKISKKQVQAYQDIAAWEAGQKGRKRGKR